MTFWELFCRSKFLFSIQPNLQLYVYLQVLFYALQCLTSSCPDSRMSLGRWITTLFSRGSTGERIPLHHFYQMMPWRWADMFVIITVLSLIQLKKFEMLGLRWLYKQEDKKALINAFCWQYPVPPFSLCLPSLADTATHMHRAEKERVCLEKWARWQSSRPWPPPYRRAFKHLQASPHLNQPWEKPTQDLLKSSPFIAELQFSVPCYITA